MANFLQTPIFTEIILPFLFVFTLFFAILDRTKILGDDKRQINAILAFVVAGIFIGVGNYAGWIQEFTIFLIFAVVIVFIFMLVYGFAYGTKEGDPFKDKEWIKLTIGGIAFVALVIATLVITDSWDKVWSWFGEGNKGSNIALALIIIVAVWAVLAGGKKKE
jgi:hypothetical protein